LNCWCKRSQTRNVKAHTQRSVDRYINRLAEELYDLRKDHDELNNLANDPEYAEIKNELRTKLLDWMRSQGDEGQKTEMEAPLRPNR